MFNQNDHGLTGWKLSATFSAVFEYLLFVGLFIYCLYQERGLLFFPHFIAPHDNYYFLFPIFYHFADSLIQGHLALWNPYVHGGEVFYPLLVHAQLLDPVAWIVVLVGKVFTRDLSLLFHWNLFVHAQIFVIGVYLYLRRRIQFVWTRYLLVAIVQLSSLNLAHLRQPGLLFQCLWLPWALLCLSGLYWREGKSMKHWLGLAIFLSLQMQSYWFSGMMTFLVIGCVALLLWHREQFRQILSWTHFRLKLLALIIFLFGASLPNFSLLYKQGNWMSPMRAVVQDAATATGAPVLFETPLLSREGFAWIPMSEVSGTGTFSKLTDFAQLVYSHGNRAIHRRALAWGNPSEAWSYIGLMPFLLAMIGFFYGRDDWKRVWGTLLISFALVGLGPRFFIYNVLYYFLPPLWYLRHLHTLQPFFLLSLLYFVSLGSDRIVDRFLNTSFEPMRFSFLDRLLGWWPVIFSVMITLIFHAFLKCSDRTGYLGEVTFLLILPVGLIGYAYTRRPSHLLVEEDSKRLLLLMVIGLSLADLVLSFKAANYLYQGQPSPAYAFDLKARPSQVPGKRVPVSFGLGSPPETDPVSEQYPRYLSILSRVPSALSELWNPKTAPSISFEQALHEKRWNSFILHRSYHDLIHSSVPPSVQTKLFAIGDNPFQWIPTATAVSTPKQALKILGEVSSQSEQQFPLVIETGDNLAGTGVLPLRHRFDYSIVNHTPNSYTMETKSERSGYVFWSDGYDPDWVITIDGIPTQLFRANVAFKAFHLDAGMHHIELKYRPYFFLIAVGIYFMFILSAGMGILLVEGYHFLVKIRHMFRPLTENMGLPY